MCTCTYNGSFYSEEEKGPYSKFSIPHGPVRKCEMIIQEPLNLNPSGLKNLSSLYDRIPDYFPPEFNSYPVAGDALPSVTLSRMAHDHVYCVTHQALIRLSDQDDIMLHMKQECLIDWPFKDVHRITGDSHEVTVNLFKSKNPNSVPLTNRLRCIICSAKGCKGEG